MLRIIIFCNTIKKNSFNKYYNTNFENNKLSINLSTREIINVQTSYWLDY